MERLHAEIDAKFGMLRAVGEDEADPLPYLQVPHQDLCYDFLMDSFIKLIVFRRSCIRCGRCRTFDVERPCLWQALVKEVLRLHVSHTATWKKPQWQGNTYQQEQQSLQTSGQ